MRRFRADRERCAAIAKSFWYVIAIFSCQNNGLARHAGQRTELPRAEPFVCALLLRCRGRGQWRRHQDVARNDRVRRGLRLKLRQQREVTLQLNLRRQ